MKQTTPTESTAASRYEALAAEREPYLVRARECARYTIPSLLPEEGKRGNQTRTQPWQSIGARGLNSLASKLTMALLPPGTSFFRLSIDAFILEELATKAAEAGIEPADVRAEYENALVKVEQAVTLRLEQKGVRTVMTEGFRHLALGNVMVQQLPDCSVRLHYLTNYVVKRDFRGEPIEIIVKEARPRTALPKEIRALVEMAQAATPGTNEVEATVDVYTRLIRRGEIDTDGIETGHWEQYQEVCGEVVPGSEGQYPLDKCAFLPLRWTRVDGEDYGRGIVEEYLGDLRVLDALSGSLVKGTAIAARALTLLDPNGFTEAADLEQAPDGAIIFGRPEDVHVYQAGNLGDYQVAKDVIGDIERRLAQAFMMTTSIQRSGERVTATEWQYLAQELEATLGGQFSLFSQEFQLPLVSRTLYRMQETKDLPQLPDKAVSPQIIAGMEGLGRRSEKGKSDEWTQSMQTMFGPQIVAEYVSVEGYGKRIGAALGLEVDSLLRTDQEVMERRAQQQQEQHEQQLQQRLAPEAMRGLVAEGQQEPQNETL